MCMKNMELRQIAKVCDGVLFGMTEALENKTVAGVVLDSRQVQKDYLFIATKGAKVDGHKFIPDVFAKGAMAVVCEELPEKQSGPCILVKNSFSALKQIAGYYRRQLAVQVVGITGSVGKTSTKEFIASVLSQHFSVHKTAGNFNNEVGMPLTILGIRKEHEIAVIEMGISDFGEMHRLSEVAAPNVCVMTNIGQCHLENLIDRDGVLRAKSEIFDFMAADGVAILNGDDDKLAMISRVAGKSPIRFGMSPENDIWADNIENLGLFGSKACIHITSGLHECPSDVKTEKEEVFEAEIRLAGSHMIYNAMAATAVGRWFGMPMAEIAAGICNVQPVAGRSHLIKTAHGVVIDDCYNANPVSMKAAIDLLKLANTRKVAVLGDMFELGENEMKLHGEVGEYAAMSDLDVIVCVGKLCKHMYTSAKALGGNAYYFETKEELLQGLEEFLTDGDTILVKASHGMAFDGVVAWLEAR